MTLRYDIEVGTNAVRVYYPDSDVASLYQPNYPDGSPWIDADDANAWAQLYIASVEDEEAPFAPNGPGLAGEPKPTPEQIAEAQSN